MARFPWFSRSAAPIGGSDGPGLLATVSVLNALEPVAERLQALLPQAYLPWAEVDHRLAREGRLEVFSGAPPEAHALASTLRAQGLTTSLNLLPSFRG